MPFYTNLRISQGNTAKTRAKKKRVATNILKLNEALTQHFVDSGSNCDVGESVKIATWNLREFGGNKLKGRDYEPLYYIAEIISRFDIIALQEIRADLEELIALMRILGSDWEYIATDVTDGDAGNGERMVFVYNQRHVQFRNIAGELTLKEGNKIRAAFGERIKLENGLKVNLPANAASLSGTYDAKLKNSSGVTKLNADLEIPLPSGSSLELPDGSSLVVRKGTEVNSPGRARATVTIPSEIMAENLRLRFPQDTFDDSLRQFARTPYLLSFQAGWLKINLCTVHIFYGSASDKTKLEQRRSEIEQLTKALAEKAKNEFKYDDKSFLGVLGDFNILGEGHPTMTALESHDFVIPEELKSIPGSNVARDKAYDQIAFWKPARISEYARLDIVAANIFDFYKYVYTQEEEAVYRAELNDNGLKDTGTFKTWRTYKMSDHLPMWVEIRTDFSKAYLENIVTDAETRS